VLLWNPELFCCTLKCQGNKCRRYNIIKQSVSGGNDEQHYGTSQLLVSMWHTRHKKGGGCDGLVIGEKGIPKQ